MTLYLLAFIFIPAVILAYWFAAWIVVAILYVIAAAILSGAIFILEFIASHLPRRRVGRFG